MSPISYPGANSGALVQLRDTTLPAYTTQLDNFSANLATQFSTQGLPLFTISGSPTGTISPSLRDSRVVLDDSGQYAGDSDTVRGSRRHPNQNTNGDGYTGLIDNVLTKTFAATITNGTTTTPGLATQAGNFVAQQSADTSQAGTDLTNATAYQTTVASALSNGSAVDVDQQMGLMIQLQNSYQANAQVITTTSTLFTALLNIFVQSA